MIVNIDDAEDPKAEQLSFIENVIALLKDKADFGPIIAVGGAYKDIKQISRSFIEAAAAMEQKIANEGKRIIFFDEVVASQKQPHFYSIERQMLLVQSLKQGNKAMAVDTLGALISTLSQERISAFMIKFICSNIIYFVVKTIDEIQIKGLAIDIEDLVKFASLNELKNKLTELVSRACDYIEANKESRNIALRDSILSYIEEHFRDADMSREKIAEKFNLSPTYFSSYFKEQTGVTFMNYLTDIRMAKIKEQLAATEMPIKDIIVGCGYSDVSNFVRKFRSIVGMTPGEYRRLYRHDVDIIL